MALLESAHGEELHGDSHLLLCEDESGVSLVTPPAQEPFLRPRDSRQWGSRVGHHQLLDHAGLYKPAARPAGIAGVRCQVVAVYRAELDPGTSPSTGSLL